MFVCYLDQLESVGFSYLIPCKTLSKISVKYPSFLSHALWCSINIVQKSFVRDDEKDIGKAKYKIQI